MTDLPALSDAVRLPTGELALRILDQIPPPGGPGGFNRRQFLRDAQIKRSVLGEDRALSSPNGRSESARRSTGLRVAR